MKKIGIIPVGKYRWQWNFVRILIGKSRWPLMLFIYLSLSNCLHGFIYCHLFFKLSNIFKKINIKGPYISSCRIMSFIYISNYRPNLYSLFLSWKHGSFCDPEKNWVQNMECKKQGPKNRVIVTQKEKAPGCLFSFWITMTLFFSHSFLHPIFYTPFLSSRP